MTERAAGPNLYRLIPGQIWRFLKTQSASFWFLCIYMFFEYVRPQQLFPVIDVLPWAQMTLIGALVSNFVFEGGGLTTRSPANLMLAVFALLVVASTVAAYMPGEAVANYDAFFGWNCLDTFTFLIEPSHGMGGRLAQEMLIREIRD